MIRRTTACVKDLSELSSLRGEKRNKFDAKTARSGSIVCVPSDGSSFLHLLVFASVWSSEYNRGWGHVHGWVDAISWPPENFLSFGQRSHCSCTPTRHHAGRAKLPEPRWVRILFVSLNFDSSFVRYSTPSCKLNRQTLLGFATQFFT